jgi:hypothetical protein
LIIRSAGLHAVGARRQIGQRIGALRRVAQPLQRTLDVHLGFPGLAVWSCTITADCTCSAAASPPGSVKIHPANSRKSGLPSRWSNPPAAGLHRKRAENYPPTHQVISTGCPEIVAV